MGSADAVNDAPPPVDLTNCDREPIHIPGAVQPHGVLLAVSLPDERVVQASANAPEALGVPVALGLPLGALLDAAGLGLVRTALADEDPRHRSPLRCRAPGGAAFDAVVHRSGGLAVVELEPARDVAFADVYRMLQRATSALAAADSARGLGVVAARAVRELTGFDRVMVYEFDRDDHGHVIAEDAREGLESFLDLHYPASDIPAQARRLYTVSTLRLIVDVAYRPAPIEPARSPDGSPLDLSFSVLRSVSPIHVEYLRNMGVCASMSLSLVVDGRLWGLVICHHYAPRFVAYDVRRACDLVARTLSGQVGVLERAEAARHRADASERLARLAERLGDPDAAPAQALAGADLLALVDARGAAIVGPDGVELCGDLPPRDDVVALAAWVRERGDAEFDTHRLAAEYPPAAAWADVASGLLAVACGAERRLQVLWFRPEQVRSVSWAGDPQKTLSLADGAPRLSPRGSFALWKETVRGQSEPFARWHVAAARELARALESSLARRTGRVDARNRELEQLNESLRAANLAKDEFLAVVSHELRTPLNAMLGWVQILRRKRGGAEQVDRGIDVIDRNARAQLKLVDDLLDVSRIVSGKVRIELQPIDLADTVRRAVEAARPAAEAKGVRLMVVGGDSLPDVAGDAERLQQVFWNLLANAVKFTPRGGRVTVRIDQAGSYCDVSVADDGEGIEPEFLPHVFERFRQAHGGPSRTHGGLGLGLSLVRHFVELHGGSVTAASEGRGRGATFRVRLPILPILPAPRVAGEPAPHPATRVPAQLEGLRVWVVEDEDDSREFVTEALRAARLDVTAFASAPDALHALARRAPDVILSDVGMPGMDGYEFLRRVRTLPGAAGNVPAVALTAYARTEDRQRAFLAGFDAHVPKPVEADELFAVLAGLSARRLDRRPPEGEAEVHPGGGGPLTGVRALLVGPGVNTAAVADALESQGVDTRRVEGPDAVAAVLGRVPADVVVVDVASLGDGALELMRSLRAGGLTGEGLVPAIAVTASTAQVREALLAGYTEALVGGVEPAALAGRVLRLVRRRRPA